MAGVTRHNRITIHDPSRLAALKLCTLAYTPPEERFDRIARITSLLQDCAIATLSFIDEESEWFKSCYGLTSSELAGGGIGVRVIEERDLVVTLDARLDPAFAHHPMVTKEPYIRFYAGYPIMSPEGHAIGVLAMMDQRPHRSVAKLRQGLADLAKVMESEIYLVGVPAEVRNRLMAALGEIQQRSMFDQLTGIWNRGAIFDFLSRELARTERKKTGLSVIMADVDHFKTINDHHGHLAGDIVLRDVGRRLRELVRSYDGLGRYGGEEFLLVLPECGKQYAAEMAERVCRCISDTPFSLPNDVMVEATISVGCAVVTASALPSEQIAHIADQALYRAKRSGRNCAEIVDLSMPYWEAGLDPTTAELDGP